jgi:hypothetical protein
MAIADKKNDLRLVRDDKEKGERWNFEGYQRLDDRIVMYRRYVPVTRDLNSILMHVFDFNSNQTTVIVDTKGYDARGAATAMQIMHFSQYENKQAIKDAHRALTDLGGHPPSLGVILGDPDLE